jgi:hypothetical protein
MRHPIMRKPQAKTRPSGLRALEASGDGFWELNLLDGSAWFSDWFVAELGWDPEAKPATWAALRKVLAPQGWERVLTDMRAHLERRVPFDVEVAVVAAPGVARWWRLRGEAERNEAGQAHYFSGGVQDVSAAHEAAAAERRENDLLGKGFEALPTAAAFIDSTGMVLRSNDAWRGTRANADSDYFASLSEDADTGGASAAAAELVAGLREVLGGVRGEFAKTHEIVTAERRRLLRVRARPFEVEGVRRLAVVHEET